MPWNEVLPMDEKTRFLADVRSGLDSVAELCRRHGISRQDRLQVDPALRGGRARWPR